MAADPQTRPTPRVRQWLQRLACFLIGHDWHYSRVHTDRFGHVIGLFPETCRRCGIEHD